MASAATFRLKLEKLERQQRIARMRPSETLPADNPTKAAAARVECAANAPLSVALSDSDCCADGETAQHSLARQLNPRHGMRAVIGDAFTRQRFLHHQRQEEPTLLITSNQLTLREYLRGISDDTTTAISQRCNVAQPLNEAALRHHHDASRSQAPGVITAATRKTRPSTASAVLSPAGKPRDARDTVGERQEKAADTVAPTSAVLPATSSLVTRPASAMLHRTRGRLDELLREEGLRLQQERLQADELHRSPSSSLSPRASGGTEPVVVAPAEKTPEDDGPCNEVFPESDSMRCDIFVQEVSGDDDSVDPSLLDDVGSSRLAVLSRPTSAITRKPPIILRRVATPSSSVQENSLRYRPPSASPAASLSRESETSTPVPPAGHEPGPASCAQDIPTSSGEAVPVGASLPVVKERPVSASLYAAKFRLKLQGLQTVDSVVQSASSRALQRISNDDRPPESSSCFTPASAVSSLPSSREASLPKRVEFSLDDVTPASTNVDVPSDVESFVSSHFFSLKALNEELWRLQTTLDS